MMKKVILLALVVLASASFNSAHAEKKKKKEVATATTAATISLNTGSDSLSYAAGRYVSQGITAFLQQEYLVDTTYMSKVIEGFNHGVAHNSDPEYQAYNAGAQVARMLLNRIAPSMQNQFDKSCDSIRIDMLISGFTDALRGDTTLFTNQKAFDFFEQRAKADREEANNKYKMENEQWLATNKTKEGVVTLPSGLQYKVLTAGTGAKPTANDRVVVRYEGTLIDGTVFDSSYKRQPNTSEFGVNQVIKGWTEALCLMPVGSKWQIFIPASLAYGSQDNQRIRGNSTLIFTVELVDIKSATTATK